MNSAGKLTSYVITIFSWSAKGAGLALLLLVVVIAIGEGPPNPFELTGRELFLFVCLLVTLVGTVLALWHQVIGGIAILAGMIPFISESGQWVFWVFALIGVLNVACWWLKKLQGKRKVKNELK